MKKIIRRVRHLGQKAAELKAAVESVPPRISGLREAIAMTTGQLQQIGAEVRSNMTALQVDNEDRLIQALREINDGAGTFREAGFELRRVDLELGLMRRLMVHLDKVSDVGEGLLGLLVESNRSRATLHAILSALRDAERLAGKVELSDLTYQGLIVYVGPTPCVRLRWSADEVLEEYIDETEPASSPVAAPASGPASSTSPFGKDSFFERRPSDSAKAIASTTEPEAAASPPPIPATSFSRPPAVPIPPVPPAATSPVSVAVSPVVEGRDWRHSALDRFKKMPDLSKPRR
ncbi:MAG TPA: hypothetical protein VMS21_01110 [Methylomirabilota bacterium]|nr:hypothetical protein [Methylomirabilota bacterium]